MQDVTIWTGWGRSIIKVKNSVVINIITNPPNISMPQNRSVWVSSRMGSADDIIAQFRPGCIVHAQGLVNCKLSKNTKDGFFLYMKPSFVYIGHTKYMADNPRKQKEQDQEDEELRSELSTVCLHKPLELGIEEQMQLPDNHLQIVDDPPV